MYLYCGLVCRIFFKKNSNNPSLVYFGERVKVNDEFIKKIFGCKNNNHSYNKI